MMDSCALPVAADSYCERALVADYKYVQGTDAQPFGAIGRIWFKNQVSAGADSMTLYKRYFAKPHTWPADQAKLGANLSFDDHLSYRADGALWAKSVLEQAPPGQIEHKQIQTNSSDGEIKRLVKTPKLIEIAFSGGQPFVVPGGPLLFRQRCGFAQRGSGKMLTGSTLGDCGRLCADHEFYLTNVFGDPTVKLAGKRLLSENSGAEK